MKTMGIPGSFFLFLLKSLLVEYVRRILTFSSPKTHASDRTAGPAM